MPPEENSSIDRSMDIPLGSSSGASNDNPKDVMVNTSTKTGTTPNGYHLRWSRLYKVVEVKNDATPAVTGDKRPSLRRGGSISASFHMGKKSNTGNRVILDRVSGSAAPGQVLACMGPRYVLKN